MPCIIDDVGGREDVTTVQQTNDRRILAAHTSILRSLWLYGVGHFPRDLTLVHLHLAVII